MTRIVITLLFIAVLAMGGGHAATIEVPVTLTGTGQIEMPEDTKLTERVAKLEKRIQDLETKLAAYGKVMVIPADAVAVPLETLVK